MIRFTDDFYTRRFAAWCDAHFLFAEFVNHNVDKIARKVRKAARSQEDEADVLAEVEIAKLLLGNGQPYIEYEPFGTADANPDFRVTLREESCCVEVKRIRPSEANTQQSTFLTELVECLCAIPSNFAFSIDNFQIDKDSTYALLFSKNKAQILDDCRAALINYIGVMESGDPSTFVVPNAGGLEITFFKLADKDPSLPTSYFGGVEPVIFRNEEQPPEWFKFTDDLCGKLRLCGRIPPPRTCYPMRSRHCLSSLFSSRAPNRALSTRPPLQQCLQYGCRSLMVRRRLMSLNTVYGTGRTGDE